MKKISKKFLAIVVFISALLCQTSYAQQTSPQSEKLASEAGSGEIMTKEESILIRGKVIEYFEALPTVDSVAIFSFSKITQNQVIVASRLKSGEFQFQVPKSMSGTAMFMFISKGKSDSSRHLGRRYMEYFVIEDSVNILIEKKSGEVHLNITGGKQNRAKDLYLSESQELSERMNDLYNKKVNGLIAPEAYRKEQKLLSARIKKQKIRFIINHPYSLYALYLLHGFVERYLGIPWKDDPGGNELKEYKKLFFALEKPVQEKGHNLLNLLQNADTRKVPSFTGKMPDGKIFDLADLKGKVVLIDFWGSWCGSCRKGHPHLKELYTKYKDKGFEIIGVGVEHGSREEQWEKFRKAISEDGITWPQILMDRQKRDLAKEYGISYYPSKFLVDRDGRLVLRAGSDIERLLDAKLAELFNEDNKSLAKSKEIYKAEISSLKKGFNEVRAKLISFGQGKPEVSEKEKKAIYEKFLKLYDEILTKQSDYVSNHRESPYSLTILKNNSASFIKRGDSAFRVLDTLYNGLSEHVRALDTGKFVLGSFIRNYAYTSEGEKFVPFSFTNSDGRRIDLADLKGKVILLDFWGSWCHWCREAFPHLKELYAKYKGQGLEIVGISREHGSKETQINRWKKAIEEDGIPWLNALNDPDGRDLVKEYSIRSYPSTVLIDKKGVIVVRNIYQGLEEKIKELLNQ